MVVTNFGTSGLAVLMAGTGSIPRFCALGTGSTADLKTIGSLTTEIFSARQDRTGSVSLTTTNTAAFRYDFGAGTMSGTALSEIGQGAGSTIGVQDLWVKLGFGAINFDGSNELVVDINDVTF